MPRRKSDKPHVLPLHIGDWRKDPGVRLLTYSEKGVYVELLIFLHECPERGVARINGRALTLSEICFALVQGVNPEVKAGVARIVDLNVVSVDENDGAIYSRRMIRDERIRVNAKEFGRMGGNPALVGQGVNPRDKPQVTSLPIQEKEETIVSSKEKRASRLHEDWRPTITTVENLIVECPDVDQERELKNFHDHWRAIPGKAGLKLDWEATYRKWVRKAQEFITERRRSGGAKFQTTTDRKDRAFEERVRGLGQHRSGALGGDRANSHLLPPSDGHAGAE